MTDFGWSLIIDSNTQYFQDYLSLIEAFNESQHDELASEKERIEREITKGADPQEGGEYLSDLAYQTEEMEQLIYSSFTVSIFIFMEARVIDLCSHIERTNNQVFSHKDLQGNGIGRAVKYLNKMLGADFPIDEQIRKKFNVVWKIRNALVHNEGVVQDNDRSMLDTFLTDNSGMYRFDGNNKVSLTFNYIASLLDLNKSLCSEISSNWKVKEI